MGRNIVVCCDGTANQFDQNNTNVVKLYAVLVDDAARQLIFYHPGVGTMEAPGALTSWGQKATIFAGMAVGYGAAWARMNWISRNSKSGHSSLSARSVSNSGATPTVSSCRRRSCRNLSRPIAEKPIPSITTGVPRCTTVMSVQVSIAGVMRS